MRDIIELVVPFLVTARVTIAFVVEDGPLNVFGRIRMFFLGKTFKPFSEISALLSCTWCLSFWIGLIVTALFQEPWYYSFGYSLFTMVIDEYVG